MSFTEEKRRQYMQALSGSMQATSPIVSRKTRRDRLGEEKKGFVDRVTSSLSDRGAEFKETFAKAASGEISPLETGVRFVGDVSGGIGDVLGAAVEPQVRNAIEKVAETELGGMALQKISEGMEAYEGWKQQGSANERIGEMIESVVNISDLMGGAALGKSAAKITGRVSRGAAETATSVGRRVGQVAEDIIPKSEQVVNFQVTRALDLTQGDVANIRSSTGNEVGEWMAQKNLIRENKADTQAAVDDFFTQKYTEVRENIRAVDKNYAPEAVPRYQQTLDLLAETIEDVPGKENELAVVRALQKKENVSLEDVQEVKELLDDHFSLFTGSGDPKLGELKDGVRNMRKDIKGFIEKEVKENTGADIGALNNDVSTAKGISIGTAKRSTRGLTRSNLTIGDFGIFGTGSVYGGPLVGAALLLGKKVMESPAFRLRFAKWVDDMSDLKKLQVKKELKSGMLPTGLPKKLKDQIPGVGETVGAAAGAGIVDEIQERTTQE